MFLEIEVFIYFYLNMIKWLIVMWITRVTACMGKGSLFAFMLRLLTWWCVTGLMYECDRWSPSPYMSLNTCGSYPVIPLFTYVMLLLSSESFVFTYYLCMLHQPTIITNNCLFLCVHWKRNTFRCSNATQVKASVIQIVLLCYLQVV